MLLDLYTVYGAVATEESLAGDFLLWYCRGENVTVIA